jgi:5-methyltetrahydrofolate--homocysteine methyltransferase
MKQLLGDLKERILILDGGFGTLVQEHSLTEEDYRGKQFQNLKNDLKGNGDVLNITRPDVVEEIHYKYLLAGSDIIETNTLNSNTISQKEYGLENYTYQLNEAAVKNVKNAISRYQKETNDTIKKYIAGSMGNSSKLASISSEVSDTSHRNVTFDELVSAFEEQARGLIDGGVDLILIETIIDGLNTKAAIVALENVYLEKKVKKPIIISAAITDTSGRILSGQTLEAFFTSVKNENVVAMGLNCSFGAKELIPFIKSIASKLDTYISVYPNAGFRNVLGEFDETPKTTAELLKELIEQGLVNIVGGCCGTTPSHIKEIVKVAKGKEPRVLSEKAIKTVVSGLEELIIDKEVNNFINVGERTNVAGSKKFARLINEKNYDEAINIAREQVKNGAQVIDINFDDGMLDAKIEMDHFLKMIGQEPEICKVPIMIDSSNWEVIEAGMKAIQGKHIINSISLKEGEEEFIKKATTIKKYGCAVVVMAFDEVGQADTYERKINVCKRAYDILVNKVNFSPEDIIFDANILTIATGIKEHKSYGLDFIKAVAWIKENLPYAKTSGGVSNLSFAFRGNNKIREMMHSVFLYHGIKAGLDMAILNPGMITIYDDIEEEALKILEDVILNRKEDSEEDLIEYAKQISNKGRKITETKADAWREESIESRLVYGIQEGITSFINEDILELINNNNNPLDIINGPLMKGMNKVGELFGQGKMFLPQVIKSARVMKIAVEILSPYIEKENQDNKPISTGKILLATVKGDVHDIGKNITGVVLGCNNFEVVDIGIMVPPEEILKQVKLQKPDIIGLSGLITPSLEEMTIVAKMLNDENLDIPLIIGGATTSKLHTALKIEPSYKNRVVHVVDASSSVEVCNNLVRVKKAEYLEKVSKEYSDLRETFFEKQRQFVSLEDARKNKKTYSFENIVKPSFLGVKVFENFDINEVRDYINWSMFFKALEMKKKYPEIIEDEEYGEEARRVYKDANEIIDSFIDDDSISLNAVFGIFPANSSGDDIIIFEDEERNVEKARLNMMRRQEIFEEKDFVSCADFISSKERDYIGLFTATAGIGLSKLIDEFNNTNNQYKSILASLVADRLVEAFAEKLNEIVKEKYWFGVEKNSINMEHKLIRPSIGYPSIPDHSEKEKLMDILNAEENIGVKLTSSYMMEPVSSVSGLYFANNHARYFEIGKILDDQVTDYALRKNISKDKIVGIISNRISVKK